MCMCVYMCIYVFMYIVFLFVFIDIWITTVNALHIKGPDPGTPPIDQGGHHAAYTYAPDPNRMHCKQGPKDGKEPGVYKPHLFK